MQGQWRMADICLMLTLFVLRKVMIKSRHAMSGSVFGFRKVTLPW